MRYRPKHKVRCIEKIKYATVTKAETAIVRNFVLGKDAMSYYECPRCLDFHLTKKYDNRTESLRKRCRDTALRFWFPNWRRKTKEHIMKMNSDHMRHLIRLRTKEKNVEKHQAEHAPLPYKIKPETLGIAQQKEALARLHEINTYEKNTA